MLALAALVILQTFMECASECVRGEVILPYKPGDASISVPLHEAVAVTQSGVCASFI